eukprot:CAMPEP_0202379574 /NCGR_PEP_ID=MMETSP1127-20130417/24793_1 /ASSEMBLY_ACC=CAM_ASM_000462 /TAXON_ID=3047 /ORGANISM="Dunaliella tertiolecta, Strain CCMP1320" /LENGTH=119 /DNA_ID=CAMNT_0048978113 /DNA_START=846 /DNA_END=1205 /DNA_ORIENTATION=+
MLFFGGDTKGAAVDPSDEKAGHESASEPWPKRWGARAASWLFLQGPSKRGELQCVDGEEAAPPSLRPAFMGLETLVRTGASVDCWAKGVGGLDPSWELTTPGGMKALVLISRKDTESVS